MKSNQKNKIKMVKTKLTMRGQKLSKANDDLYKILKRLSESELKEFLYLITKNYYLPLLDPNIIKK